MIFLYLQLALTSRFLLLVHLPPLPTQASMPHSQTMSLSLNLLLLKQDKASNAFIPEI